MSDGKRYGPGDRLPSGFECRALDSGGYLLRNNSDACFWLEMDRASMEFFGPGGMMTVGKSPVYTDGIGWIVCWAEAEVPGAPREANPFVTVNTADAWVSSEWRLVDLGGGWNQFVHVAPPKPLTSEDKALHRAIGFGGREENRMGAAQYLAGDDD